MNEVNSLSIIENTDMTSFKATMSKIGQFQKLVRENLTEGKDYGTIPGTSKPTLYKPGAEKILMLMGLQSTYEIIDSTRDWQEGFFQYQVRCTLKKEDSIITQGLGCCNSKENKYARQNPFNIDNTILKMAKKRSQVDASLTVASLSEIFTQDLEDTGVGDDQSHTPAPKPNTDFATMPQVTLIKKQIISSHLLTEGELKKISGYLEGGMTKAKGSEIISWWLGDQSKSIAGERAKREARGKEAKPTKTENLALARHITGGGKLELKKGKKGLMDDDNDDEPGSSYENPIKFTGKKKKISEAEDYISDEDLPE